MQNPGHQAPPPSPQILPTATAKLKAVPKAAKTSATETGALAMINVTPGESFIETPYIQAITDRALSYLRAGFPVHMLGPTGSGKTTLAFHISSLIGRPVVLVYGDDEFRTSDLVGADTGYQRRKVVDNYVHNVLKVEENVSQSWIDNRLTVACREGYTLIYDEFTRSRPEANNALLSVLSERVLVLPASQGRRGYLKVHPEFRAIFTSNPAEYVGTHRSQDALLDRMVTIHIPGLDRDTEIQIAISHSNLARPKAERVTDLIRHLRDAKIVDSALSIRAVLMICKVVAIAGIEPQPGNPAFDQICFDVMALRSAEQQAQFYAVAGAIATTEAAANNADAAVKGKR